MPAHRRDEQPRQQRHVARHAAAAHVEQQHGAQLVAAVHTSWM
jgi:hypothetical protein